MGKKLTPEEIKKRKVPPESEPVSYRTLDTLTFFIPPDINGKVATGKSRPRVTGKGFSYYQEHYENFRWHSDPYLREQIEQYKKQGYHFPVNLKRSISQNGELEVIKNDKGQPLIIPTEVIVKLCVTQKKLNGKKIAWVNQGSDSDNIFGAFVDLSYFANGYQDRGSGRISERVLYDDNLLNIFKQQTIYIPESTQKDAPLGYGAYIIVNLLEELH